MAREALARHSCGKGVHLQLDSEQRKCVENSKACLLKIFTSLKYLARQGLAIRGKTHGNFDQLLLLRSQDDPVFKAWLNRKTDYCSDGIKNELLEIMAHSVLKGICADIKEESRQFAIVVDGTQDVAGVEQESICIRHVDKDLGIHEDCLGLYSVSDTTDKGLCSVVPDSLFRLNLPVSDLRFQTYDGASNMSGTYKGCQAAVKEAQPLALYVDCGPHVTHLISSKAAEEVQCVRNGLTCVHELSKLKERSGKFREVMQEVPSSIAAIKPICPTRWLARSSVVRSVINEYDMVLQTLEKVSKEFCTDVGSKAIGLLQLFRSGNTLLGLLMAQTIVDPLEKLNKSLQSAKCTVHGMLEASSVITDELSSKRSGSEFGLLFQRAQAMVREIGLEEITAPRPRKLPKKFHHGSAEETVLRAPQDFYRVEYFKMLDKAGMLLTDYFNSSDLNEYRRLADLLIGEEMPSDCNVAAKYPEIDVTELSIELPMFRRTAKDCDVLQSFQTKFSRMAPELKSLFPNVERLLRLLLLCPATSCTAERSFGALRRLKTRLRSTMLQKRLNHLIICNIHVERLDKIEAASIAKFFCEREDRRRMSFGTW